MNEFEQESHTEQSKFLFDWRKKDMDILDDMGVSKLSAKVFFKKVNYSFNNWEALGVLMDSIYSICILMFWNPSRQIFFQQQKINT